MNVIQMDTREKAGKKDRILDYFSSHDIKVVRSKLYVGDYARLDNQTLCIDTKKGLQEVYSNVITEHDRFRSECLRAKDAGIQLVILVEQPHISSVEDVHNWYNPRAAKVQKGHKAPVNSWRLQSIMRTIEERYGIKWEFCDPAHTGKTICDILHIQ